MPKLIADRPVLRMTSELGRVIAAAKAREAAGERVMHLERGEPDFDTPPHVVEALAAAARAGETHYPDARGTLAFRETLVEKLGRENGIKCEPDDVVVTDGGTHGLFLAFQGLLSPGDEVLIFSPFWMALPKLVAFAHGASLRAVPAYLDLQSGALTPDGFADLIRRSLGPSTRGIYVNTPNNPTGVVLERAHLEAIAKVAIERDLWVISDEAYEHLLFDGAKHVSIASLPGMGERTVSVYTFSKSYAMTGWRLGYVVSPKEMRPCMRRDLLIAGLEGQSAIRVPKPRGAFYAFANVEAARAGRDVWALIEEWLAIGVAVLPGTAFGPGYEDWVRMSLATRRDDVAEGARRLREHVLAAHAAR
jgi:aspartate aminotransferase